MRLIPKTLPVLASLLIPVANASAETIAAKRIASHHRLVPMSKITVGPDDQYQGVADPSETAVYFTRKTDLAPHLCRQDLRTGKVTDVLPLSADSQDPALSPDGKLLAFTYYRYNASGDICTQAVSGGQETCLKTEAGTRSSPFWKSARELGYLIRDDRGSDHRILVTNLDTQVTRELARGAVWAPAISPDGKHLFFNQMVQNRRVLMMKDLDQPGMPARVVRFSLPGISGFPSVSADGKFLYFSHYLNDTNHDNVIDGNDNSAIFRVAIDRVVATPETQGVFPQQLTSVESNCSFPRPQATNLYATCAARGSLDIYQLPLAGVVPASWSEDLLWNAHQTSRTYQDRVLLLNTLKFSFEKSPRSEGITERLLSDHLMADDLTASKYYAESLASGAERDSYRLLLLYLDARQKKKMQPAAEISDNFKEEIQLIERSMDKIRAQGRLSLLFKGLLQTFLERPKESLEFLKKARASEKPAPMSSLERYFLFELGSWTLVRTHTGLFDLYREMMAAPELGTEARIYYAYRFLESLEGVQRKDQPQEKRRLAERMDWITRINQGLPEDVSELLKSEWTVLNLVQGANDAAKAKVYAELDKAMSKTRSNYFLRKALYIRAILNFAEAGEFKYLDYVASNWLRYTQREDTEFSYSRAVYAGVSLDRGYDSTGAGKLNYAGNFFYGSLSLTDDLESHLGYIRTMIKKGERATIDERYRSLKERQFIEDNLKFVEALLILMDAQPGARDVAHLDQAMDRLSAMDQSRDSPIRYLLMGYCELEKLLRTGAGYEVDLKLYEASHHHLMLAYDLGRNSERIQAAALTNLGVLHQRVQNHGLASKFFAKRKEFPFLSLQEKERFTWKYAKSLYYVDQPEKAADEVASYLAQGRPSVPLEERQAFYLQAAGKYEEAAEAYARLLGTTKISGAMNRAKAELSYGFSLFKLKREKEAMIALRRSLENVERLRVIPKSASTERDRFVDFNPTRLRLAALGLLSRMGTDVERLEALRKREDWLPQSKDLLSDFGSERIQNQLQQAKLLQKVDPKQAVHKLAAALKTAEELGGSIGYLSTGVFHALVDLMVFALVQSEAEISRSIAEQGELLGKLVEKTLHAYDTQKPAFAYLGYQGLKIRILWSAFSKRILKSSEGTQTHWQESETANKVRKALPREWAGLEKLAQAVGNWESGL